MSKTGTLISVAQDQEGAGLEIVTPDRPLPTELVDVTSDDPLPVESLGIVDLLRDILDTNKDIVKQLKITNSHFTEWDGDEYDGS